MGAHAVPMPPRKRRAFNPKRCPFGHKKGAKNVKKQRGMFGKLAQRFLDVGGFVLWGCSPHAPGNMGCCIPSDALAGIKASHIRKDSSYMGACAAPMPSRKRRAFNPKFCPCGHKTGAENAEKQLEMFGKLAQRFLNVGVLFCGAARPTPPAT